MHTVQSAVTFLNSDIGTAPPAVPNLTCCCCGTTFTKLFKHLNHLYVSWLDFSHSCLNYLFCFTIIRTHPRQSVAWYWCVFAPGSSVEQQQQVAMITVTREDGKAARAAAGGQTWRPCLTRAHSFIFILGSCNSSYLLLTARATAYIVCDYDLIHSLFAERIF